jgi:hypothetical protein
MRDDLQLWLVVAVIAAFVICGCVATRPRKKKE